MQYYNPNIQDQNLIIGKDAPSAKETFVLLNVKNKEERDTLLGLFFNKKIQEDCSTKDNAKEIYTYAVLSKQLPKVKDIFPDMQSCLFLKNWHGGKALENDDIEDIKEKIEKIDKYREKKSEGTIISPQKIGSPSEKDEESLKKGAKYVEYRRLYGDFKIAAMYILPPVSNLPIAKKSVYNLLPKK